MMIRNILSACALSAFLLSPHSATAERKISDELAARAETVEIALKSACEDDLKNYCSNVTPGEARIAFCIIAHEDKISEKCRDAAVFVADKIEIKMNKLVRKADMCRDDFRKACNGVSAGDGQLLKCIRDHQDNSQLPAERS